MCCINFQGIALKLANSDFSSHVLVLHLTRTLYFLVFLSVLGMFHSENKIVEQIVFYSCPSWKHVWHHMNHLSVPSRTVCFDSNLIPEQSVVLYCSTYWSFHYMSVRLKAEVAAFNCFLLLWGRKTEFHNRDNLAKVRSNKHSGKTGDT